MGGGFQIQQDPSGKGSRPTVGLSVEVHHSPIMFGARSSRFAHRHPLLSYITVQQTDLRSKTKFALSDLSSQAARALGGTGVWGDARRRSAHGGPRPGEGEAVSQRCQTQSGRERLARQPGHVFSYICIAMPAVSCERLEGCTLCGLIMM